MKKKQLKYFHTSDKQDWETPPFVFDILDAEFGFTLDVCATPENAKCERYFTPEDDGLSQDWCGEIAFMNPPYKGCGKWMKKAWEESLKGATVVCLVPARTDYQWFHKYAMKGEIRFFNKRLPFVKDGKPIPYEKRWSGYGIAPFPSALVIFRPGAYQITAQQIEIPEIFREEARRMDNNGMKR